MDESDLIGFVAKTKYQAIAEMPTTSNTEFNKNKKIKKGIFFFDSKSSKTILTEEKMPI